MILLHDKQAEIINGLLPLLREVMEEMEEQKECDGRTLIYNGVTKDIKGNQIQPDTMYVYTDITTVKVDHEERLKEVIKRAPDVPGMMADLSRYLVKYGKSKTAIKNSRKADQRRQ